MTNICQKKSFSFFFVFSDANNLTFANCLTITKNSTANLLTDSQKNVNFIRDRLMSDWLCHRGNQGKILS